MQKNSIKTELEETFKDSSDYKNQVLNLPCGKVEFFFIDSLINKQLLSSALVSPLVSLTSEELNAKVLLSTATISGGEIKQKSDDVISDLLSGFVAILLPSNEIVTFACQGYEKRAITEPPTSAVLKGPREGFVEDVNTNISLIRRKVKSADLNIKDVQVGKYSNTLVKVVYISTIADKTVVNKVIQRLKLISIDAILDSSYIQKMLEEKHSKLFKQVGNTEKPDVAVAKLMEGRVVVLVDGSPIALTVPYLLIEDFQSADDYFTQNLKAVTTRILRVIGFMISIALPGIYVAMQSFHYALLPIDFLITLQSSIESLSFPPIIEILFVLFLFEILNEASVRMPKYLGMALSIIGALVLGDTAVQAGIISPPAVIMVAISGVTLYMVPDLSQTAGVLRLIFTVIGGVAGFYGILVALVFVTAYLMTFDSYGTPYFAPYAPMVKADTKDGIIIKDLRNMKKRPKSIPNINSTRQEDLANNNKASEEESYE